jgi:hypothetical protein
MRAAPGRGCSAPRLIARLSRQIGIASLNVTGGVGLQIEPPRSQNTLNSALIPM